MLPSALFRHTMSPAALSAALRRAKPHVFVPAMAAAGAAAAAAAALVYHDGTRDGDVGPRARLEALRRAAVSCEAAAPPTEIPPTAAVSVASKPASPAGAPVIDVPTGVVDDVDQETDTSSWYKSQGKNPVPLFPARQLFTMRKIREDDRNRRRGGEGEDGDGDGPADDSGLEYPHWNEDWDGREHLSNLPLLPGAPADGDAEADYARSRSFRKDLRRHGVHRHFILVRHGQYEEVPDEDERVLTELGREQARLTGIRILEMVRGAQGAAEGTDDSVARPVDLRAVRVSGMVRAVETANIIAGVLEEQGITLIRDGEDGQNGPEGGDGAVRVTRGDPDLNEGRPAHTVPTGKVGSSTIRRVDIDHGRAEAAFHRYFYRADPPPELLARYATAGDAKALPPADDADDATARAPSAEPDPLPPPRHEFEIVVCHGNMIRYYFCRLMQLPPEAWLRMTTFNCSLSYFVVRPTGSVSCRSMGDMGHLPYDKSTFSMHHGFNW